GACGAAGWCGAAGRPGRRPGLGTGGARRPGRAGRRPASRPDALRLVVRRIGLAVDQREQDGGGGLEVLRRQVGVGGLPVGPFLIQQEAGGITGSTVDGEPLAARERGWHLLFLLLQLSDKGVAALWPDLDSDSDGEHRASQMVALTIVAYAIISGVDGPGILPGAARPPGPRRALPVRARSPSSLGRRSRKPRPGPAAGLVAAARPDRAGSAAPGEAAGLSRLRGPRNGRLSSRPTPARRQQGPARAASSTGNAKRAGCSGFTARSAWQNNPICARPGLWHHAQLGEQIGGAVRCYQAIFVPSTALASPGYDGQPAVYLYIAALEVTSSIAALSATGAWRCR